MATWRVRRLIRPQAQVQMKSMQHILSILLLPKMPREHRDFAYMEGFPGTKPKTQCIQMCLHKLKVVCGPSGLDPGTCFPNLPKAFNGKLQGWHPLYTNVSKCLSEVPRHFLFKWDIISWKYIFQTRKLKKKKNGKY